jgi:hypothetical protein
VLATRDADRAAEYSCRRGSIRTGGGIVPKVGDRVVVTATRRVGRYWKVTVVINPRAHEPATQTVYVIRAGDHYLVC